MRILSSKESKIICDFLKMPIPPYIRNYSDEQYDLMDCYEIGFVFANDLLKNKNINPNFSPWGDGKSVIFEPSYSKLLSDILNSSLSDDIDRYCRKYLEVLDVFKSHLEKPEKKTGDSSLS